MGNGISQSQQNGKGGGDDTASASSAYGRLRIDSPDYRLNSPSYRSLEGLRQRRQNEGAGAGRRPSPFARSSSENGLNGMTMIGPYETTTIVEGTPLLNFQKDHENGNGNRDLHGGFIDTSSIGSKSTMFEPGQLPPPILQWIGPALLCAFAYALYNIFIKKGSASIHPIFGGVILQFVAALLGCILCLTLVYGPTQEELFYDSNGVWYAVYAGMSVGAAEIISFMVSGMGVPAVQSIPTIIGG
eukprot:CAMPEP_0203718048 /NCGR_PEP_ID=MMETSP0092-20131115/2421_1 /ASSEMBLY_ACC=CAM_ASM_001090 /TAXON_ID=426623 /ORGANISM="Chaetoceros affinis, Strain CCMP159" /LENGTH=243 /DNA_ID=CAMNT_0050597071 /DNA_START=278 /DNA_END=1006 /DNA_ORIENTATION=+